MPEKDIHPGIRFQVQHTSLALKNRKRLKAFIAHIFKKEKTPLHSLSFIFCTDDFLLDINKKFLQHNYYTDIITFNLSGKWTPVEGEIYISLDRVKENAKTLNQFYYQELHQVVFHGVLHLCGYKDKSGKEISTMRKKENEYLQAYFK